MYGHYPDQLCASDYLLYMTPALPKVFFGLIVYICCGPIRFKNYETFGFLAADINDL